MVSSMFARFDNSAAPIGVLYAVDANEAMAAPAANRVRPIIVQSRIGSFDVLLTSVGKIASESNAKSRDNRCLGSREVLI